MASHDDVTVRRAVGADLPGVADLRWESTLADLDDTTAIDRNAFTPEFVRWASDHAETNICCVAERGGRLIGMAWLAVTERTPGPGGGIRRSGDVETVYVIPDARNAGIGGRLLAEVMRLAEASKLEHLTVHANERAAGLYRRAGFEIDPMLLFRVGAETER